MNNLIENYERILEVLRKTSKENLLPYQRRRPKMSDLELIASTINAEYMSIESENAFFLENFQYMLNKIERSVYNKWRRRLATLINNIRLKFASLFNEFEDCYIVDSMI